MMNWTEHTDGVLRMFLENMVAEGTLAHKLGLNPSPSVIVDASREALLDVIHRSIPLSRMMDASDIVLHAEGPSVRDDAPKLSAFNWLSSTAERTIRKLSSALFDLLDRDAKQLGKALDLRFTGMAPGSLYVGFAMQAPAPGLLAGTDEPAFEKIRAAVRRLPTMSTAIDVDAISARMTELVPDAAERDAGLLALHQLSPSGRHGIHTIDLSSPGSERGTLSARERVVLADAIKRPTLANRKTGQFTGEVRGVDLDASRIQLRNVSSVGSLRCVMPSLDRKAASSLIGEYVRLTGEYESDRSGKPRLLIVSSVEPVRAPQQGALNVSNSGGEEQNRPS